MYLDKGPRGQCPLGPLRMPRRVGKASGAGGSRRGGARAAQPLLCACGCRDPHFCQSARAHGHLCDGHSFNPRPPDSEGHQHPQRCSPGDTPLSPVSPTTIRQEADTRSSGPPTPSSFYTQAVPNAEMKWPRRPGQLPGGPRQAGGGECPAPRARTQHTPCRPAVAPASSSCLMGPTPAPCPDGPPLPRPHSPSLW